ncbi:Trypanosome variant surface glycoprotein (A-type), putative [Trypanosoma equiperdum]|uniref:Trypanosome variant surface glycoprotein (A-type), putative n=1 Tax=Trypanosoma equiperdum TaxID=5694 RepID=A0A1G4I2D8_TRYEQ|nr:Trypanosome variant surface glycoprotein (A-type), putative [Trypanosoma equiperdum]
MLLALKITSMQNVPLGFLMLITAFCIPSQKTVASGPAIAQAGWQALCVIPTHVKTAPGLAIGKLTKLARARVTASKLTLRLQVLQATAGNNETQRAAAVLAELTAGTAATTGSNLYQAITPAVTAAPEAAVITGRISEYINLLRSAQTVGSKTGYCLAGAAEAHAAADPTLAACVQASMSYASTTVNLPATLIDETGFKGLNRQIAAAAASAGATTCVLHERAPSAGNSKFHQESHTTQHLKQLLEHNNAGGSTTITIKPLQGIAQAGKANQESIHGSLYDSLMALNRVPADQASDAEEQLLKNGEAYPRLQAKQKAELANRRPKTRTRTRSESTEDSQKCYRRK